MRRFDAAADGLDREPFAALLTEDFTYRSPLFKRPVSRRHYLRVMRAGAQVLGPSEGQLEEMVSDPGDPDAVWVRMRSVSRPPGHAEIDTARWERWTLTPDRERIRAITFVAFVPPLVTA